MKPQPDHTSTANQSGRMVIITVTMVLILTLLAVELYRTVLSDSRNGARTHAASFQQLSVKQ